MKKIIKNNYLAVIILLHGSIYNKLNKNFIRKLKNIKNYVIFFNKIFISYIENAEFILIKCINNLIKINYKNFLIIPIFISIGKHIKLDLPIIIKNILKIYNKIKIFYSNNIGRDKNLIKIIKFFVIKKIKILNKLYY